MASVSIFAMSIKLSMPNGLRDYRRMMLRYVQAVVRRHRRRCSVLKMMLSAGHNADEIPSPQRGLRLSEFIVFVRFLFAHRIAGFG